MIRVIIYFLITYFKSAAQGSNITGPSGAKLQSQAVYLQSSSVKPLRCLFYVAGQENGVLSSSIWAAGINLNMVKWWNKFEKCCFKQGEINFLTSDAKLSKCMLIVTLWAAFGICFRCIYSTLSWELDFYGKQLEI